MASAYFQENVLTIVTQDLIKTTFSVLTVSKTKSKPQRKSKHYLQGR